MVLNLYIYLDGDTYLHTYTSIYLILVWISHRSYRAYSYTEVPLGTTKFILIPYGLYLDYGDYTCLEVPVGTTEILQNLFLYFRSYTCIPKLILVFQIFQRTYISNLYLYLSRTYNYSDLQKDIYLNFCQTDTYPDLS